MSFWKLENSNLSRKYSSGKNKHKQDSIYSSLNDEFALTLKRNKKENNPSFLFNLRTNHDFKFHLNMNTKKYDSIKNLMQ